MLRRSFALGIVIFLVGCAASSPDRAPPSTEHSDKFQLRVSLFAWVPEKERFARWIETSFQAEHPDIDLVVRPMKDAEADDNDLSYDFAKTIEVLRDESHPDHQHLVEIDTVTLGKLVEKKAVQPFEVKRSDYFPFAQQAVRIGNVTYGVPHWTCGYFVMTTSTTVANARTAAELRRNLAALGTPRPDLGGAIGGSTDSVMVYLDAFQDTYPRVDLSTALDDQVLEQRVGAALGEVGAACTSDGAANCNANEGVMEREFATGRLDALIGYSERLNEVLTTPGNTVARDRIRLAPAPLGAGRQTILYTDALVQSVRCTSSRCRDAARRFAEFYVSDRILALSMMGRDGGRGAVPRYLLPSTRGALRRPEVRPDPIYRQLAAWVDNARPYPNRGVPEAKKSGAIKAEVHRLLHKGK